MAGVAGFDKASLVACNDCKSLLLCCASQKMDKRFESFHESNKKSADTKMYLPILAGVAGFEPTNAAVKVLCLTA